MAIHSESKVQRGEPIRIQADTWNDIMDVIRAFKRDSGLIGSNSETGKNDSFLSTQVKNTTGSDLTDCFKVLKIATPLTDIVTYPRSAFTVPNFTGTAPAATTDNIAITQETIISNAYGRAIFLGLAVVKVLINNAAHKYARPVASQTGYLESATAGPATILWQEATTGTIWCVINLIGASVGALQSVVFHRYRYTCEDGDLIETDTTVTVTGRDLTIAET